MEKLTKEQAIELHRRMWNWVASEVEKRDKPVYGSKYFDAMGIPLANRPRDRNYCCEYARQQAIDKLGNLCYYCPLDWKSECGTQMCDNKNQSGDGQGLYLRYLTEKKSKECKELAMRIAKLKPSQGYNMKKLSKERAMKLHNYMWNWILDETERTGNQIWIEDYFDFIGMPERNRPFRDSYCCEYARQQQIKNGDEDYCRYCPLDWKSEANKCMCLRKKDSEAGGLLYRWGWEEDVEKRMDLIKKIANLEERCELCNLLIDKLNDIKIDNTVILCLMPKNLKDQYTYNIIAVWECGKALNVGSIALDENYNEYKIFIDDKYISNSNTEKYKKHHVYTSSNIVFRPINDSSFLTGFLKKNMEGE